MTTKAERAHMTKVADMPCVVCFCRPVEVHHALKGGGGRKDNMKVLPLCFNHHRGAEGIHTLGRKKWWSLFGHERDLLARVQ